MKPYSSKHLSASKGNLPKSGKKTNQSRNQFKRYFKKSLRRKMKNENSLLFLFYVECSFFNF